MRWGLTREMSIFSVKINVLLPPIVRIRLLLFFLYRDTHGIPDAVIEKYVMRV